jgi:hypothetical protein
MRFLCFSWIDSEVGTLASASQPLLETLLDLAFEVDLLAEEGVVTPTSPQKRHQYVCP